MLDISEEVSRRLSIQQKNAMREIEDEEDERQRQAAADWANGRWDPVPYPRARPADEAPLSPAAPAEELDERSYQDYLDHFDLVLGLLRGYGPVEFA